MHPIISGIILFSLAIVLGCNGANNQGTISDWPDKIYHLHDVNHIEDVTGQDLEIGKNYLALDSSYLPVYIQGGLSGSLEGTSISTDTSRIHPLPDTQTIRVICSPPDLHSDSTSTGRSIGLDQLRLMIQHKVSSLYFGTVFKWEVDTSVNTVQRLASPARGMQTLDYASLQTEFSTNRSKINVIVHDHYAGVYGADSTTKIIKITKNGLFNPSILIHEIGHIFKLCHPTKCCNLCTCYRDHFMYQCSVSGRGQIMARDWLILIGACVCSPAMCDSCNTDECQRPLNAMQNQLDEHLDCIDDCELPVEFLRQITQDNLIQSYDLIGTQDSLIRQEYALDFNDFFAGIKGLDTTSLKANDYAEIQGGARRNLRLTRFMTLIGQLQTQGSNINPAFLNSLFQIADESLKTGVYQRL